MENSLDLPISINTPLNVLEDKILQEEDITQLKDIINIFNLNIQKKNIVRVSKLTELQDLITQQMEERVKSKPGEFNNQDLLAYFKTVQETLNKSNNTLDNIDTPAIQVNQNLNINVSNNADFDKASRERIMDAVKSILAKADQNESDAPIIDIEYKEDSEVN